MVGNDNTDAGFNGTGQELIFQNKSSLSISHSHEHEHEVSVGTSTHTNTHAHTNINKKMSLMDLQQVLFLILVLTKAQSYLQNNRLLRRKRRAWKSCIIPVR